MSVDKSGAMKPTTGMRGAADPKGTTWATCAECRVGAPSPSSSIVILCARHAAVDALAEEVRELREALASAETLLETLSVALIGTNAIRARQAGEEAIKARAALARGGR